jgi:two-component system sensor histidine kinase HydH
VAIEPRETSTGRLAWIDLLWFVFLGALALLPPFFEIHKQLILLGIGIFQLFEPWLMRGVPLSRRGRYSIVLKILLGSLLIDHTGGINSSYYPIYYVPVVSAAMLFSGMETLVWTLLTSVAYCSFLIPAVVVYELTPDALTELAIRNLFFFLTAIVVNRFVTENRNQAMRYQRLAATLAKTNQRLEQAQAEARRSERLAALGQLSAGLAHEIRNPLGVIKGSAEMLNRHVGEANPLAAELSGYISSEVERLNALVGRFLDFARPMKLNRRPEDIVALLDRSITTVQKQKPDSRVIIERRYSEGLQPLPLDADLCAHIFDNLVANAIEAMPEGGKLRISAAPANSNGLEGVEVSVEDTGPGVAEDIREQIFNPFFTTKKTGVGLGLSIVSKMVDHHGGWIRLENGSEGGAFFRLFFPRDGTNS